MTPDPATLGSLLGALAEHGILGVLLVLAIWGYVRKDRELAAEKAGRLEDAKAGLKLALQLKTEDLESRKRLESLIDRAERLPGNGR